MRLFLLFCIVSVGLFAAEPAKPKVESQVAAQPVRFRYVVDDENKILASWDRKDDSVDFKVSKEVVLAQVMKQVENLETACNQRIYNLQNQLSKAPKEPPTKGKK